MILTAEATSLPYHHSPRTQIGQQSLSSRGNPALSAELVEICAGKTGASSSERAYAHEAEPSAHFRRRQPLQPTKPTTEPQLTKQNHYPGVREGSFQRNMRSVRTGTWIRHEIEIQRSRFITTLAHTATEEDAREFIALIREEFPDATHNCSAFVVKPDDMNEIGHSNDDGEPSGTAGAPMLDVLRRQDLVNVTAVVTRYFGGTLLGAGRLIRAYSTSVSETLERAQIVEIRQRAQWLLRVPHSYAGRIEAELRNRGIHIVNVEYLDTAHITCAVPPDSHKEFASTIAQISGGAVSPTPLPPTTIEVDVSD